MAVSKYVWDPEDDNIVLEKDGGGATQAVYTHEPGLYGNLISQRRGSTTSYYHYDALGSTRALTEATESVTDTNLYDAWGVNRASSGTTENPFRWVGELGYYFDAETSNYSVRRRSLRSTVARFTSRDPMSHDSDQLLPHVSAYAYVDNNPANRIDPSGMQPAPRFSDAAQESCNDDEKECVKRALGLIDRVLRRDLDCFAGLQCQDSRRMACDSVQLAKCILSSLAKLEIACARRGAGGCHADGTNAAHIDSPCGAIKSLASLGIMFPPIIIGHRILLFCQPCEHPLPSANDCSICPDELLGGGKIFLCQDKAPRGRDISGWCGVERDVSRLAAILVHEASHNCVGGHHTTGGAPEGRPTCDSCRRPDSTNIEAAFVSCERRS